jgi:hypothetical protein
VVSLDRGRNPIFSGPAIPAQAGIHGYHTRWSTSVDVGITRTCSLMTDA